MSNPTEYKQNIADFIPALIAVYNLQTGQYLYINPASEKLLGYKPSELMAGGVSFVASLMHPDDVARVMQQNAAALEEANLGAGIFDSPNPIVTFEYRLKHKNGEWRWFHTDGIVFSRSGIGDVESVLNISIDITERKSTEHQLLELTTNLEKHVQDRIAEQENLAITVSRQTERMRNLLSTIPGVVWEAWGEPDNKRQRTDFVSDYVEKMLGYTVDEWLSKPLFWSSIIHPEDEGQAIKTSHKQFTTGNGGINRFRWVTKQNKILHIEAHSVVIKDEAGEPIGMRGVNLDVTERVAAEEAKAESEDRLRTLIENVQDYGIYMLDPNGNIMSWNSGADRIYGYTEEEVIGKHNSLFFVKADRAESKPMWELQSVVNNGKLETEGMRRRKDGSTFYVHSVITALYEKDRSLRGFVKVVRDVTERKVAEDTIRHQALHDSLTGLPNRKALEERLELALKISERQNSKVGLMFIDLDRFKNINDTLGHMVGDELLKEVASRFTGCVRDEDTVSRLGGDEFIIMIPRVNTTNDLVNIAEKILSAISKPVTIGPNTLHVTTSIGITMAPADGNSIHALLKNADTALYRAKDAGRNRFQFYNQTMNVKASVRFKLENDFRDALGNSEFELYYQPIIAAKTKKAVGVEALLRWNHPKLGVVYPNEFIPIAEESGMIGKLGKWVLETACRQNRGWLNIWPHAPLHMAVNISPRQFSEPGFVKEIAVILEESKMPASFLDLEITETVAMENIDRTTQKLSELKKLGVHVTIDDFGTGYSSLLYLKRFPINNLKIDKSFVRHAITNSNDATIIRTIISMAHNLNLHVIAEGVETDQQMEFLTALRCDRMQGYLIGRPLPESEFRAWLQNNSKK